MADKDGKGAAGATTSDSLIDFSKLPPSALDNYIAYYDLAKAYPPPPVKRRRRSVTPSSDTEGNTAVEGVETDEERASKRIDSANTITTSTRLRPRSPTGSMAHLFPGSSTAKRDDELPQQSNGTGAEANGKEEGAPCPSHFFDAQEADSYLASLAGRHFASQPPPKEGEVVVQFLYRCRAGDKCLKVAH